MLVEQSFTLSYDLDAALAVINNWRAAHGYPLLAFRMTLTGRARRVDDKATIGQRLKRLPSIAVKLERKPNMALSQMQDVGGCRAVLKSQRHVEALVALYEAGFAKNPNSRAVFVKKFDYVAEPKIDGYRSVHLVCRYRTDSAEHVHWNGLRIEIQIRSRLQHAWATAVETVDTFTRQTIKTGGGKDDWRRFFLLMGGAIALMEGKPAPEGVPAEQHVLRKELRSLSNHLKVKQVLRNWSHALKYLPTRGADFGRRAVYLLELDAETVRLVVRRFDSAEQATASEQYLLAEKAMRGRPASQAVLVSVEAMHSLRVAFPNYFADTRVFVETVNKAIQGRFRYRNSGRA